MIVLNLRFANAQRGFWSFTTLVPLPADVGIILIFVINTESTICQIAIWRTDLGGGLTREFYRRFEMQNRTLTTVVVLGSEAIVCCLPCWKPLEALLTLAGSSKRTSGRAWHFLTPLLNAASCIQNWYFAPFLQNSPTSKGRPLGLPYGGQKEWEKNKDLEALWLPSTCNYPFSLRVHPTPMSSQTQDAIWEGQIRNVRTKRASCQLRSTLFWKKALIGPATSDTLCRPSRWGR